MNGVTLRAQILEHNLTRERIADGLPKVIAHFSHDFSAFQISFPRGFAESASRSLLSRIFSEVISGLPAYERTLNAALLDRL